jgi:hypothetical protein
LGAEPTVLIHPNLHTPNRCITNAGDKRFCLRSICADANRPCVAHHSRIADIDVVITCSEVAACFSAYSDVPAARCIRLKRTNPSGRVVTASRVGKESVSTSGRIEDASCVATERV